MPRSHASSQANHRNARAAAGSRGLSFERGVDDRTCAFESSVIRNDAALDLIEREAPALQKLARDALDRRPVTLDELQGIAAGGHELRVIESETCDRFPITRRRGAGEYAIDRAPHHARLCKRPRQQDDSVQLWRHVDVARGMQVGPVQGTELVFVRHGRDMVKDEARPNGGHRVGGFVNSSALGDLHVSWGWYRFRCGESSDRTMQDFAPFNWLIRLQVRDEPQASLRPCACRTLAPGMMLPMSLEESHKVVATAARATDSEPARHAQAIPRETCWVYIPEVSPAKIRAIVMRWNGQWIGGDRFARDYAAGVMMFNSEVTQAVTRFHPARYSPETLEFETHSAVWAAILVAFEAASFRDSDRETLLAALLGELRAYWSLSESSSFAHGAAIFERAMVYFALRDRGSQLKTATQIVNSYLLSVELPAPTASSALARHLSAIFGYRILRDLYRLSAASRLRTAAVSLVERRKSLRSATSTG
jgi:hypothetical protein